MKISYAQLLNFFSTKSPPLLQDVRERSGSAKIDHWNAIGLLNSLILKKPRTPVSKFDKLLQSIFSSHQHSFRSRSILVCALSKIMASFEIQPSLATLNMVMDCCSGVGRLDLVFSVLARIHRLGFSPDVSTYTTLLTGLIAHGCAKQFRRGILGKQIIDRAVISNIRERDNNSLRLKDLVDPRFTNLAGHILANKMESQSLRYTYTCLFRGLFMSSRSKEEAATLLDELIDYREFAPTVYTALNDALCQQGLMTVAHTLLQHAISNHELCLSKKLLYQMIQYGHTPAAHTYQPLIDAFNKQSQPDKAEAISHRLLELAQSPTTVTVYNASQPPSSTHYVSPRIDIDKIVAATDVYSFLMDIMCKIGKPSMAIQLFESLSASGVEPDVRMYNLMVTALCKDADNWDHTTDILSDMARKDLKLDASHYNPLLERCRLELMKVHGRAGFVFGKIEGGLVQSAEIWPDMYSSVEEFRCYKTGLDHTFRSTCKKRWSPRGYFVPRIYRKSLCG